MIFLSVFYDDISVKRDNVEGMDNTNTNTTGPTYNDISYNSFIIAQSWSATNMDDITNLSYEESKLKYDNTVLGLNKEYHKPASDIIKETGLPFGTVVVQNPSGGLVFLRDPQIIGTPIYYNSMNIRYNPQNYVPTYEDSVYLSKLTPSEYYSSPGSAMAAGSAAVDGIIGPTFCDSVATRGSVLNQETMCQKISPENCEAYSCCVNLGGAKCVAGNKNGPLLSSNYSDIFIRNRDYYYYQGVCYGNCKDANPPIPVAANE
jgi:hypothetical protein